MSGGWKDVMKNGWHPEKTGGSSGGSSGGLSGSSLRSQVKGLVGRGDSPSTEREARVAAPISSLRDPSSFAPPPKHVAAYGAAAAAPTQAAPRTTQSPSPYMPSPNSSYTAVPTGGQTYGVAQQPPQAQYVEEAEEVAPEPKPYRVDTTGLATSHLPPPPTHHSVAGTRSPQLQSPSSPAVKQQPSIPGKPKVPPSLPPRLPPRSGNSTPSPTVTGGQEEAQGYLNQGAVNRLGAAGISVPGFGIGVGGRTPPPPPLAASPTQAPGHSQTTDELQARFARMGTSSSHTSASPTTETGTRPQSIGQVPSVLGKKKPPPPPPK